jgi:trimeric autotransporter adhesin
MASQRPFAFLLLVLGFWSVSCSKGGPASIGASSPSLPSTNPAPSLTSVSPASIGVGSSDLTITVNGSGFIVASVVNFNGQPLKTIFQSATQLTAVIPTGSLVTATNASITVSSPCPRGGASLAFNFQVLNPAPSVVAVSPSTVVAPSPSVTVVVTGAGFVDSSVIDSTGSLGISLRTRTRAFSFQLARAKAKRSFSESIE